jgi:dihydroflavonol-4-reductase
LRCWKRHVPLIPPGGLNFVDVRDVARGHLLAAERGKRGRRYILGGENLTVVDFVRCLAEVRGLSSRWRFRMPLWLNGLIACAAELRARLVTREPYPSLQQVRMNRYHWYYSSDRARTELGFEARPLRKTLEDTHAWCCATGRLKPRVLPLPRKDSEKSEREAA